MKALKVSGFRTDLSRADETMARAPKMTRRKISLAPDIHCCPNLLFLSPDQRLSIVRNVCVCVCVYIYIHTHTHTSKYVQFVSVLPLLSKFVSEILLHESVAVRSVDWIFIMGVPALR